MEKSIPSKWKKEERITFLISDKMTISLDAEKIFYKIPNPFMIKVLKRLETQETYLNLIKAVYNKPIANIILN